MASSPRARQKAFLSWAPDRQHRPREAAPRPAPAAGRSRGRAACTSGRPATTRATESSQREAMGRSWTRKRSAIPESRRARRRPRRRWAPRRGCRWSSPAAARRRRGAGGGAACRGAGGRPAGCSGATSGASARPGRRRQSTMGRSGESSSTASAVGEQRQRAGRARGRRPSPPAASPRAACARRSVRTASAEVASQARWKPPSPFTATTAPVPQRAPRRSAIGSRAAGRAAGRSRSATRGPQAGQALGWAWKRRSRGSAYSRAQAGHMREAGHGGGGPVVGDAQGDGEARAAVGAVGERVAVAPVGGVAAARAGSRGRWRGRGGWRPRRSDRAAALDDLEAGGEPLVRDGYGAQRLHPRRRRGLRPSRRSKRSRTRPGPKASTVTPAASFQTRPVRPSSRRQPVDERPEADALHRPGDRDAPPFARRGGRWRPSVHSSRERARARARARKLRRPARARRAGVELDQVGLSVPRHPVSGPDRSVHRCPVRASSPVRPESAEARGVAEPLARPPAPARPAAAAAPPPAPAPAAPAPPARRPAPRSGAPGQHPGLERADRPVVGVHRLGQVLPDPGEVPAQVAEPLVELAPERR